MVVHKVPLMMNDPQLYKEGKTKAIEQVRDALLANFPRLALKLISAIETGVIANFEILEAPDSRAICSLVADTDFKDIRILADLNTQKWYVWSTRLGY